MYQPEDGFLGGYTPNDGTIEFYGRVKAFARPEHSVLDLGAGRGAWFDDDASEYRRQIRALKGHVNEVIAADVDDAVMNNRSSDRNVVFDRTLPLADGSVDIIIADYVLEHVQDPAGFASEVRRLLRPSGLFCARTPHKYNYIAMGARVVPNRRHSDYLQTIQPERKSQDVFPTAYKVNTISAIRSHFDDFEDFSYIFRSDPSYYFRNRRIYTLLKMVHHIAPSWFSGNIFAFLQRM